MSLDISHLVEPKWKRWLRDQGLRLIMSLLPFVVLVSMVLHTCAMSGCSAEAEPRHLDPSREIDERLERVREEMEKARHAREDARAIQDALDRVAQHAEVRKTRRVEALAAAMEAYIVHLYCDEPIRQARERGSRHPERACRIDARGAAQIAVERDLLGFAYVLTGGVDQRAQDGQWVPFGRDLAPAWLAAVSYHEFSWYWRNTTRQGSIGERCAFQVADGAIRFWARQQNAQIPLVLSPEALARDRLTMVEAKRSVSRDPVVCLDVATTWMGECARQCGSGDVREFLHVDENGEPKRQWRSVTVRYLEDGRFMTTKRVMQHVVMPTAARAWFGAYATPGICGGAIDIQRERFETAWWIARHIAQSEEG